MGNLARRVLGISAAETTFERRRFRCDRAEVRERLEAVGRSFVFGYHSALETGGLDALAARLDSSTAEMRGFVYEGAAMGLTVLDEFRLGGGGRWSELRSASTWRALE